MKHVPLRRALPVALLTSLVALPCFAGDNPVPAAEQNTARTQEKSMNAEEGEHDSIWLDARQSLHDSAVWLARGVDSWFGDKPFEEGGWVREGRIRTRLVLREQQDLDFHLRFRVKMRLPNLEERANVVIGSENESDLVRSRPDTVMEQQRILKESRKRDDTLFAGLGLDLFDNTSLHIGLRDFYKPYLKFRYENEWELPGKNRFSFQETPYWALNDGVGETTVLEFEHSFSPDLSVRWLGSGTLSEEDDGLDWYSSIGLYRVFEGDRLLSVNFLADGETGTDVDVKEFGSLVKWRQPVWHDWLFGELSVGHYRYKERAGADRNGQWALGVGLQMNF